MRKFILVLSILCLSASVCFAAEMTVEKTLDTLHEAASKMDYDTYIGLYSKDAVFFGTAVEERWPYAVFADYVKGRFSAGNGWTYALISRNVFYTADKNTAWFDELLQHKAGVARGTGVLVKDGDKWLITQYNLSFPFPNELFGPFLEIVKESGLTKMPK